MYFTSMSQCVFLQVYECDYWPDIHINSFFINFTEQVCVKDGLSYEEGSMIPSDGTDACEVCHCCVRKSLACYSYILFIFPMVF